MFHLLLQKFVDLASNEVNVLVDFFLVGLVYFRKGEQSHNTCKQENVKRIPNTPPDGQTGPRQKSPFTKNDKGEAVEPCSNVGQNPEHEAEFDRID